MSALDQTQASCCSTTIAQPRSFRLHLPIIISFFLLMMGIALDHYIPNSFFKDSFRLGWYVVAYLFVGYPVLKEAVLGIVKRDFFNEFSLMGIATLGAFAIGEYPEAVAVMLFYSIGEMFQASAVNKAKKNIKALLDVRPDKASVLRNNAYQNTAPEEVEIGEIIQIKAGEKVPLDGIVLSNASSFNTSALTGESKPKTLSKGETALAGMLNIDKVVEIQVTKKYAESSLAKILEMVQEATSRKAKTELLIRKLAKIYTPIVFGLALCIATIPYFFVADYVFQQWLYRALVFLVISCPCALVISIPLGYFGGIGAASKNGILFKGANYLDLMTKVNTVVMDKTGTLTKGVFAIQEVVSTSLSQQEFMAIVATIESHSNHPIAKAIMEYAGSEDRSFYEIADVEEIPGFGLKGTVNGKEVLAGNSKLLKKYGIDYDTSLDTIIETIVVVAIDNKYAGYISIADEIKEDAVSAIKEMHQQGILQTVILSGDKTSITQKIARKLGIDQAFGDLLPEDKVKHIEELKKDETNVIAFVGDGINDAPSLALSDVGIAMGGLGSDAAIEVADVIIQTDEPSKIPMAINIAKATRNVVMQNIVLAFGVKAVVLILGGFGLSNMWEAVFADVGVSLLAILNSVRILKMKF